MRVIFAAAENPYRILGKGPRPTPSFQCFWRKEALNVRLALVGVARASSNANCSAFNCSQCKLTKCPVATQCMLAPVGRATPRLWSLRHIHDTSENGEWRRHVGRFCNVKCAESGKTRAVTVVKHRLGHRHHGAQSRRGNGRASGRRARQPIVRCAARIGCHANGRIIEYFERRRVGNARVLRAAWRHCLFFSGNKCVEGHRRRVGHTARKRVEGIFFEGLGVAQLETRIVDDVGEFARFNVGRPRRRQGIAQLARWLGKEVVASARKDERCAVDARRPARIQWINRPTSGSQRIGRFAGRRVEHNFPLLRALRTRCIVGCNCSSGSNTRGNT